MHDATHHHELCPQQAVKQTGNSYGSQTVSGHARAVFGNVIVNNVYSVPNAAETNLRTAVLEWLSPLTFRRLHEEIRDKAIQKDDSNQARTSGEYSGRWLLESDTLDDWRSRRIRKLWIHGMPGAGKSVLASIIIDHLLSISQALPKESSFKVAFLYLSYKEQHSLVHLLGSIIRQAVQDDEKLPDPVLEAFKRSRNRGDEPPTQKDLSIMLADLVQLKPLYIVIDGLDECHRETRASLVKLLQPHGFQDLKLNLLISSRLLDEFETLARGFERVNIRADSRDIDIFIDRMFSENAYLEDFRQQDPTLLDDVKVAVRSRCDGMFLLATIHVNLLASKLTLADMRQCLRQLPTDINSTYKLAVERILSQQEEKKKLALDIFAWILHSGTMTLPELQHALSVNPTTRAFDPEYLHQETRIRDVCGGLVTVTKLDVRFVHYTAQTYFSQHMEELSVNVHAWIVEVCVNYLSMPALEQPDDREEKVSFADDLWEDPQGSLNTLQIHKRYGSKGSPGRNSRSRTPSPAAQKQSSRLNFTTKLERFPFARFAARNLGYHLRKVVDADSQARLIQLLKDLTRARAKRNFLCRLWWTMSLYYAKREQKITDPELYSSLDKSDLQGDPPTAVTSGGSSGSTPNREITALHVAGYIGWLPLVEVLISEGCELDPVDFDGRTPFIVAVQEGHSNVVGALLEAGASLNLTRPAGQDIMLQAAQEGHLDVVTMTLAQVLKRYEAQSITSAPAHLRKEENYLDFLIQLLLQLVWLILSARTKSSNTNNDVPAQVLEPMSKDIKKAILALCDSNLRLLAAAGLGEADIVQELLSREYISDVEPYSLHTVKMALFLAVESGFATAAEAILANGTDVNDTDSRGNTVLHRAALRNDLAMIEMLLTYNPDVNYKDSKGRTAWSLINEGQATETFVDRRKVLDALIEAGADPNMRDRQGVSVLYGAAAGGHIEVARYLLEVGVDPGSQTIYGWAPLHWAAADGHLEVVRLLVEAGANLNPLSDTSKTPLDLARSWKENPNRDLTVKLLVEAGAQSAQEVLASRATRKLGKSPLTSAEDDSEHDLDDDRSNVSSHEVSNRTLDNMWQHIEGITGDSDDGDGSESEHNSDEETNDEEQALIV
ncbi:hypothetical protein LTR05_005036 [Lithohypha guttulata]|uniref:NACHT domain-containing protein n=1 Tax=Lithohypha guttulata TaxID=1690604 RepID=A0AAN7SZA8_9EURO|nr:hypothetical protein LTR05_005036 [Lithohypha guttulata]